MFGRKKRYSCIFYQYGDRGPTQPIRQMGEYHYYWPQPSQASMSSPRQGYFGHQPHPLGTGFFPGGYPNQVNYSHAYAGQPQLMNQDFSQSVLQNPLLAQEDQYNSYNAPQIANIPSYNQYPNPAFAPKQPNGLQSLMNSFKGKDGSVDIPKMVNTAGQMVNALSQVSSMVKGLGGFLKV